MAAKAAAPFRIVITGTHPELQNAPTITHPVLGVAIEWLPLPLLQYRGLPFPDSVTADLEANKYDWVVFASPRAVNYFSCALALASIELTGISFAAVGKDTARLAGVCGFPIKFVPAVAGSKGFVAQLLKQQLVRPCSQFLLPAAREGRQTISEELTAAGMIAHRFAQYEQVATPELKLSEPDLSAAQAILFTSPSNVREFQQQFFGKCPPIAIAMGEYTAQAMVDNQIPVAHSLPNSEIKRISEVLC